MSKKIMFIGILCLFEFSASSIPSFIKGKTVVKKQSPTKLKESIGYEFELLLTLSSDLIAFLAEEQKELVDKMHLLLVQEKNSFFSQAKSKQLSAYLNRLKKLTNELEQMKANMKKDFSAFSKNFT
jgi:hypothetical protein